MPNIVIENTEARLIELPCVPPKVATGKEMVSEAVLDSQGTLVSPTKFMEPGTLLEPGYDMQQLKPGQNNLNSAYWEIVCSNPGVKIFLAAGYLVNRGEGTAETLVSDLDSVDLSTAKQMVLDSSSMSALTAWAESTDSQGLKKLIRERKEELISQADGRPVRGPANPDVNMGTFGGDVKPSQADGPSEASHGIDEQAGA